MKKISIFSLFSIAFLVLSFILIAEDKPAKKNYMPDDVKVIVEKSCFGCHNTASKNKDAKEELDFKKMENLSLIKKISTYKKIEETVENEDMPPQKFLNKYPDKKLSDLEKKRLIEWSKKEAVHLVKKR